MSRGVSFTSICGDCKNSVGLCSWSHKLKPVPGWDAEMVLRRNNDGSYSKGYCVRSCPKFCKEHRSEGVTDKVADNKYKLGAWSDGDKAFLAENHSRMTEAELADYFQRSFTSIKHMKRRLFNVKG